MMKYKGITYDVGTEYNPNSLTRDSLQEESVRFDIDTIKNKLNCNSVRIYGKEPQSLISAANIALQYGLNVWLSPRLINGNIENTLYYLQAIAKDFELLKQRYPAQELVFIIGGELTIDMSSFVQGDNILKRINNLFKPSFFIKNALGIKPKYQKVFDQFLKDAASKVRIEFTGKITYASGLWEKVDWTDFDYISINLYRASFNKSFYNQILRKQVSKGKPFIITEFGCASYEGADLKGPTGYAVLDYSKEPPVFKEKCIRNEKVQSDYIIDLLQTYSKEKVTGAFVFDFCAHQFTYNHNQDYDYDMVSSSITKSIDGYTWEPKESFHRLADFYKKN